MEQTKGSRKTLVGNVVSNKMEKSVVVAIDRLKKHPLYGKYINTRVKYVAHDEQNQYKQGDRVVIEECRPLSKRKRWVVKRIAEK